MVGGESICLDVYKRQDLNEDKKGTAFQFNGMDEQLKPEGQDCKNVSINFGAATATLT